VQGCLAGASRESQVSTTCGSGWVQSEWRSTCDPPATAGGTDLASTAADTWLALTQLDPPATAGGTDLARTAAVTRLALTQLETHPLPQVVLTWLARLLSL